ncbi:hypothetical protein GQ457_11G022160 [Hibiscus cannabinus]
MLLLLLSRGFDNLLELDDKGDVSTRDNGSGLGRFSQLIQISAERLAELLAYMSNNMISLRSLLEKEKLNGINFLDWFRNLRIVLKQERKEYVIEEAVPNDPGPNAPRADKDKFKKHMDDMLDVGCLMLATMTPELQKQHEDMVAYEMIQNLKEIYEGQARQERYETSKALFQCKMSEGSPVGAQVIKMMGYIQTLEKLGFALNDELAIDVVLQSFPDSFSQFILNFNMNETEKTLPQLLGMLRTAEGNMKKGGSKSVLMVREVKGKGKKVAKSKGNGKTKPKGKEALKPKGGVSKDGKCFHCGKTGHWKRNCPIYLEDVKKAKAVGASVSGIYVIDVHMSTSSSWVLDNGCGSHICTSVQGLHTRRTLAKGDVDLRVGNGARVAALAVGTYVLSLPSGLILNLENCYFVPSLTKNIISVSCLDKIGFEIIIKNNSCSFFYDNLFYGSAQLINGLYILNQENMIFNINTKRLKTNDSNQTYLWHCRLGHISERRISKLHKDGLLDPFVFEQLDVCESCLLGKMTKTPFSGKGERASDLLGLIHSDVCGPMNTQARGGYQYFITFTDDFSRYGYIYLMRHKSEALEKFKEFKNEVQNQHGKSIKALRSDRGGEYLSQDFDELLVGFIWRPYLDEDVFGLISNMAFDDADNWCAVMPLIHFALVEIFYGNRVQRQFRYHQPAPDEPLNMDELEQIDTRGKIEKNWPLTHRQYIDRWNARATSGHPIGSSGSSSSTVGGSSSRCGSRADGKGRRARRAVAEVEPEPEDAPQMEEVGVQFDTGSYPPTHGEPSWEAVIDDTVVEHGMLGHAWRGQQPWSYVGDNFENCYVPQFAVSEPQFFVPQPVDLDYMTSVMGTNSL